MTEQIIDEQTETVELTEDNSAYLTALCLMGFGAAIGVGVTKGYGKVKGVVKSKVEDYKLKKQAEEIGVIETSAQVAE